MKSYDALAALSTDRDRLNDALIADHEVRRRYQERVRLHTGGSATRERPIRSAAFTSETANVCIAYVNLSRLTAARMAPPPHSPGQLEIRDHCIEKPRGFAAGHRPVIERKRER